MEPLNKRAIAMSYCNLLDIDIEKAIQYADLIKGYAYACQTLGYLLHQSSSKSFNNEILMELYMNMYMTKYTQIEKNIVLSIKTNDKFSISDLTKLTDINIKELSVYRDRLIKKGAFTSGSSILSFLIA